MRAVAILIRRSPPAGQLPRAEKTPEGPLACDVGAIASGRGLA